MLTTTTSALAPLTPAGLLATANHRVTADIQKSPDLGELADAAPDVVQLYGPAADIG